MKTSVEWLKEYSEINVSNKELADILTLTGSKVETVQEKGEDIKNVVVGKILSIEKHPDADKLVVTKVDVKTEILQIVTGANNIKVGDIVPIAKDGSELPGGVKIKKGLLRGIESNGMMCSVGELNLDLANYPGQIEHGIMILGEAFEDKLGEDITDVLNLKECIIDFEITSNRPDCFSIEGLGRETAASLKTEFKAPHKHLEDLNIENVDNIEGLTVKISEPNLCYRYIARVVKNVKIQESPEWLKRRLIACDVRPINNIVDITNYVMLELGQPMHAFDINSIEGKAIDVRCALPNEKITTLDGVARELDEKMLVIADAKKPVAVAGVMGGENSEIEETTTTVVFESAVFNGPSVRNTAKRLGLRTDASGLYEKGLARDHAEKVINRAIELVVILGAGEPINKKIDVYPTKEELPVVELDVERINNLLGISISEQEMLDIFKRLELKVENGKVYPPYFRRDLILLNDIAEEVIRFYGYDKLGATLVKSDATLGERSKSQKQEKLYRTVLSNIGFSEICTYGFINIKDLENVNISFEEVEKEIIKIQNPLSEEYTIMRPSTVPSMMKTLGINNSKKNENVKLFDISRRYRDIKQDVEKGEVPVEEKILTLGMYGAAASGVSVKDAKANGAGANATGNSGAGVNGENANFYYLKGIIENLLETVGLTMYDIAKENNNKIYHPGRCANLKVGNDVFATFGEVHPLVSENFDIQKRVYLAEVNMDKVAKYARINRKYTPIPKFPAVERDIALVVDENVEVGQIEKIIKKKAKKVLETIELFDIFRNTEKLGENKKSVAYALKFRIAERTLTDEDINPVMKDILEELEKSVGAKIRE